MSAPNYHAWTHKPKAQGGTDPLEIAGAPIVFRAAIQSVPGGQDGTNRLHYPSGDSGDNVHWDTWDTSFDTSVYSIDSYDFTDFLTGLPSIYGVQLQKRGMYSIKAQIDVQPTLNGVVLMGTNYDEGQAVYSEVVNVADVIGGELFLGDFYGFRVDQWRMVTVLPGEVENIGTEEWSVEITFAQNNDAGVVLYSNAPPGTATGGPGTLTPGSDVWIPGGQDGSYGLCPQLEIMYWGEPDWDADWPSSFPLTQ